MRKISINPDSVPFNLDQTLACGQAFRWRFFDGIWKGVIDGREISVSQDGDALKYEGIDEEKFIRYLNLDLNPDIIIQSIRRSISRHSNKSSDLLFETAAEWSNGLRIIRQDPWECLISFICSQNSNIPAIKKRIELICTRYGAPLPGGRYRFPSPAELACQNLEDIRECSTGYRAPYLIQTADLIARHPDLLKNIADLSSQQARSELMKMPGVGPKVADCVLLFAYNRYDIVPVDVWIRTIMTEGYPEIKDRACGRKNCSYDQIADFCRDYFGEYAGYAQQFLFAARHHLPVEKRSH